MGGPKDAVGYLSAQVACVSLHLCHRHCRHPDRTSPLEQGRNSRGRQHSWRYEVSLPIWSPDPMGTRVSGGVLGLASPPNS